MRTSSTELRRRLRSRLLSFRSRATKAIVGALVAALVLTGGGALVAQQTGSGVLPIPRSFAGGGAFTGQLLAPDDSASAPSYSFATSPTTGFYLQENNRIGISIAGAINSRFGSNGNFDFGSDAVIQWFPGNSFSLTSPDLILARDAANTLAQRNGTNAQTFRVYSTYTDAVNFRRFGITPSGNDYLLQIEAQGTGTQGDLIFSNRTTNFWRINGTTGNLLAGTNNTYDIGDSAGLNRPRNIYVGSGVFTSSVTASGTVVLAKTSQSQFRIPSDGIVQFTANDGSSFTRLILGTNDATTNGISIVKNGGAFEFWSGDGVNNRANIVAAAGTFTGSVNAATGHGSSSTTGTLVTNDAQTVANATAVLIGSSATSVGYIFVTILEDAGSCQVWVRLTNATQLVHGPTYCSITKDNAATVNIYYDAAGASGAGIYLQNNRGGSRTIRLIRLGV